MTRLNSRVARVPAKITHRAVPNSDCAARACRNGTKNRSASNVDRIAVPEVSDCFGVGAPLGGVIAAAGVVIGVRGVKTVEKSTAREDDTPFGIYAPRSKPLSF